MPTCVASDLLMASTAFQGLDGRGLYIVFTQLLCDWLRLSNPMATCDVQTLLRAACDNKINCLQNRDIFAIQAQLLCEILLSGGGTSKTCLLCGTVDPVDAPECDCALYYKRTPDGNGEFWYWDVDMLAWVKFLGGPA